MIQVRPRVIFDCNVLLQAIMNRQGPAAECLNIAATGDLLLFTCSEIITELRDVLSRPSITKLIIDHSPDSIEAFIAEVLKVSTFVDDPPDLFALSRDHDDEIYLNLAIETEADFIVTWDKDMLDLMTDHSIEAKEFRQRFRHVRIVDPKTFLEFVRQADLGMEP